MAAPASSYAHRCELAFDTTARNLDQGNRESHIRPFSLSALVRHGAERYAVPRWSYALTVSGKPEKPTGPAKVKPDLTFGLKNKGRSAKVQDRVKDIERQQASMGKNKETVRPRFPRPRLSCAASCWLHARRRAPTSGCGLLFGKVARGPASCCDG